MPSCWKKFFPAKAISRLRRLFFRPRQDEGRVARASEENLILIVVDEDQISQTAEDALPPPSTASQPNEDSEPQLAEAVQRGQPLLPPNCSELQPEHIEILGNFPTRSGAFADVWDGSLAGTRVAIKSYRTYSATDPTQARMVRSRWLLRASRFTDLRDRDSTRKRWHALNFPIKTSSHSAPHTSPRNTRWLLCTTSWNAETSGSI